MGLHDFTFYDLIRRNAACFASRPALRDREEGRTLTFAEVRDLVDRLAAGLRRAGVGKGDRIGVLGKNSLEYFLLYGAAAALGAIVVPVNWRLSAEEAVYNLQDAAPKLLFADAEYTAMLAAARERLPSVVRCFDLRASAPGGFEPFAPLLAGPPIEEPEAVGDEDGFVIIHTAAVEGKPRGALLCHRNVIAANVHLNLLLRLDPGDVHLGLLPLFHVGGLFMATMAFHAGALNLNMSKFDAARAVAWIEEEQVSVLFDFSPILASLLEEAGKAKAGLGSLKRVIGIEIPETIERYRAFTGGTFFVMYGQTETSAIATLGRYDERPGSAGRPIPLAEVRLVDEGDRNVPVGEVGEIVVRGPMVFLGYWNQPAETERAFRGGWHHTGDLGRFDEEGYLFYAGRKPEKELIKPGGENVYPAEVEQAILEHPAVEKTVVFGVPDPKWKEGIKAVCQLKPGARLEARELIRFVGERIASFKKPQYVEFVAELPLRPDGTPDRAAAKRRWGGPSG